MGRRARRWACAPWTTRRWRCASPRAARTWTRSSPCPRSRRAEARRMRSITARMASRPRRRTSCACAARPPIGTGRASCRRRSRCAPMRAGRRRSAPCARGELDLSLFYPAEALPALQEEGFARLSPEDCVLYLDLNAAVPPPGRPARAPGPGARPGRGRAAGRGGPARRAGPRIPSTRRASPARRRALRPCPPAAGRRRRRRPLPRRAIRRRGLPGAGAPGPARGRGERPGRGALHAVARGARRARARGGAGRGRRGPGPGWTARFPLAIGSFFNAYGDAQALWDMDLRLAGLSTESEALAQALDDLAGARSESARRAAPAPRRSGRRGGGALRSPLRDAEGWLCWPEWEGVALTPAGDLLLCRARRADAQE